MSRFAGRVAAVTGGGRGIGRAIVLRLAEEGAAVVVGDIDESAADVAREAIARGARAVGVQVDVRDEAQLRAMCERAVGAFGSLDLLVNNAGVGGFRPFEKLEPADWDRIVGIDLRGVYLGCRAALPHLRRSGKAVILNMASQSGLVAQPMNEAYCAAKGGVVLFTRSLARELGPEGIRVNCLCPGGTETALLRDFLVAVPPERVAAVTQGATIPLGRLAQPEEVAAAACFLLSEEASYITGVALPVDGGAMA